MNLSHLLCDHREVGAGVQHETPNRWHRPAQNPKVHNWLQVVLGDAHHLDIRWELGQRFPRSHQPEDAARVGIL